MHADRKIARAEEHLKALKAEIAAWAQPAPYRLAEKRNADTTIISVYVQVLRRTELARMALIAGDAIHNIRSALDHMVYELAIIAGNGRFPPRGDRLLMFPIADAPKQFERECGRRLNTLTCNMRTRIERVQPYNRLRPDLPPILSTLRDLDDTDKHRLLNVTPAQPYEGTLENIQGLEIGQRWDFEFHPGPVVDGTEILTLFFERPSPNVTYEFRGSLVISVGHTWGPLGHMRFELATTVDTMLAEAKSIIGYLRGGDYPSLA